MNNNFSNSIKNFYSNNKKINSSALEYLENDAAEEKREEIKLKIEEKQFEAIKEAVKNKQNYRYSDDLIRTIKIFELSNQQILELLKINSGDQEAEDNFRYAIISERKITDINILPEVLDIILDFKDDSDMFRPSADESSYIEKLFDGLLSNPENKNIDSLLKIYNILKEKMLKNISEKVRIINEKNNKDINSNNKRKELDLDYEIAYFLDNLNRNLFMAAEVCNVSIPLNFVLENAENIPTNILLTYYADKENSKDMLNTERMQNILKDRCESLIRREFGPGADMVKINIDWDLNSLILFNSFNEEKEDDCVERDSCR